MVGHQLNSVSEDQWSDTQEINCGYEVSNGHLIQTELVSLSIICMLPFSKSPLHMKQEQLTNTSASYNNSFVTNVLYVNNEQLLLIETILMLCLLPYEQMLEQKKSPPTLF